MNIWQQLANQAQPFFVLAPMDDVTDTVFRQIVATHAPADLMMTEFANADGWCSPGREAIATRLRRSPAEGPVIAQIWGITPEHYQTMAADMVSLGFDGVDINMGCPVADMVKKGACSAMIENHALAAEVIAATKQGVAGKIPVSVKTRIGYHQTATEEWIGFLLEQELAAITVHGRTKKEMSKVPADWDEIAKAVVLRNAVAPSTIMIGNGDVLSREQGVELAAASGVDGIMIGRGVFQNLFVFQSSQTDHSQTEMLRILSEHIQLHQSTWQGTKRYEPLKKFFKIYINGFDGAAQLRAKLMATQTYDEALAVIAAQ